MLKHRKMSSASLWGLFLVSGLLFCSAWAEPDPEICTPGPGSKDGPELPELPNQYRLFVEANIINKNYSTEIEESYDGPGNRGSSYSITDTKHIFSTYDYKTGQSINVDVLTNDCFVYNMSDIPFNLYGFVIINGTGHIGGVKDIFTFGAQFNETYMGTDVIRGIQCDRWQACIYNEFGPSATTLTLDYYFSRPGYKMANGAEQVPVRAEIIGTTKHSRPIPPDRAFHHIYEFIAVDPKPTFSDREFEPPIGVVCDGRITDKKMSNTFPDAFSVSVEANYPDYGRTYSFREFYNYPANMMAYEYQPWGPKGAPEDPIREVHDYNLGLSFKMDRVIDECTISNISKFTGEADVTQDGHVSLRSSSSLLFLDEVYWVWQGEERVRGINTEGWIAFRQDYPSYLVDLPGSEVNSTWEYFFSRGNWTAEASAHHGVSHIPVMSRLRMDIKTLTFQTKIDVISHMFHFNDVLVNYYHFDVGSCFEESDKTHLAMNMEGKNIYDTYILQNEPNFYAGAVKSVAEAAGVAPSRVSRLYASENNEGVTMISYTLLENPPVEGDAVVTVPQPTLDEANQNMKQAVAARLAIRFQYMGEQTELYVSSESLRETSSPDSTGSSGGVSTGAVVGIAFGMLFLGMIIVSAAGFAMMKMSKGPFSYKTQE